MWGTPVFDLFTCALPTRSDKAYRRLKRHTISLPSTLSQIHRIKMRNKQRMQQAPKKVMKRVVKSQVVLMSTRFIKTEMKTRSKFVDGGCFCIIASLQWLKSNLVLVLPLSPSCCRVTKLHWCVTTERICSSSSSCPRTS